MIELMPCDKCNAMRSFVTITQKEQTVIKGKNVEYYSTYMKCTVCGSLFQTPEQMDASFEVARIAYDNLYDSPLPDEIIKIREKYNASQKAFGLLLGMGELTINSYEHGSVPSSANRTLLNLADDPYCFYKMYNLNKDKISEIQRNKIESNHFFVKFKNCFESDGIAYQIFSNNVSDATELIENEYQRIYENKIKDVSFNNLKQAAKRKEDYFEDEEKNILAA